MPSRTPTRWRRTTPHSARLCARESSRSRIRPKPRSKPRLKPQSYKTNMRHHDRVRMEFSRQALPYSQTTSISDGARLQKIVQAVYTHANTRDLDVAFDTGRLYLNHSV